jgi:Domain of unknown function (DUF4440)
VDDGNNTALLAPLLADKVVETDAEGKVFSGKEAVLDDAKSITWSSAEYPDLKVTVFGRTAIAIGTFTGKGTRRSSRRRNPRSAPRAAERPHSRLSATPGNVARQVILSSLFL